MRAERKHAKERAEQAEAEVDRLREALGEIAKLYERARPTPGDIPGRIARAIARAVLSGPLDKEEPVSEYSLMRETRPWVPKWLWRLLCYGNLATWEPFTFILTRRPDDR